VGDEVYWLTRTEFQGAALSDRRLAVGDRITITARDGRVRHLEVIALRAVGAPLLRIAAGATPVPLLLVTCRIVDPAEPERHELVRFMIEAEESKPMPLPAPQDRLGGT
jgi:hypothetical protein